MVIERKKGRHVKRLCRRDVSFAVIAVVYLIAGAAGAAVYSLLPYPFWLSLLLADAGATALVFIFSCVFRNASVYDPYWSVQPIVILTGYAFAHGLTAAGALLLIAVWAWGLRLTANWAYTFRGLDFQDWRYTMLRERTGRLYPLVNLFGIHMVPTLIVYGCVVPAVYVLRSEAALNIGGVVFFCMSVISVVLQATADIQMHRYRARHTGGLNREGLWRWSRHPNYLGEICMWWSVAGAAVSVLEFKWYLVAGAAANTLMFLFISIPMADGRQSKKEGWEEYRASTRMLLPVPKRQAHVRAGV